MMMSRAIVVVIASRRVSKGGGGVQAKARPGSGNSWVHSCNDVIIVVMLQAKQGPLLSSSLHCRMSEGWGRM